jgi:hypothetical protein
MWGDIYRGAVIGIILAPNAWRCISDDIKKGCYNKSGALLPNQPVRYRMDDESLINNRETQKEIQYGMASLIGVATYCKSGSQIVNN